MSQRANLEVKFLCDDLGAVTDRLAALGIPAATTERQEDIYFRAAEGRLKLRIIDGGAATLIGYRRPDESATRLCDYVLSPVADCVSLTAALALACGERGRVVKTRVIYLLENVRIHLDQVAHLGCFVEFEAVLGDAPGHDSDASAERLAWLTESLALTDRDSIAGGYADLLGI
jgi:adenylate cyclase